MTSQSIPVMRSLCETCPFRMGENGRHPSDRLVSELQLRMLKGEKPQICHHHDMPPDLRYCRGGRDWLLQMLYHPVSEARGFRARPNPRRTR